MAGEKRVYEYIRVRYIDTVMNAASREKEITALLKDIQPTVEMQNENDRKHLDRSISTDVAYVEKIYDASELKSAHARVMSEWDPFEHERNLAQLPKKNCKKVYYAEIICDARKRWIQKYPAWIQTEQARIRRDMEHRDSENNTATRSRIDEMLQSRFFNLIDNGIPLLNLYSQKKYDVSTTSGGGGNGNASATTPQVQTRRTLAWAL